MKIIIKTPISRTWQSSGEIILKSIFQVALEDAETIDTINALAGEVGDEFPEAIDNETYTLTRTSSGFVEQISLEAVADRIWQLEFLGKQKVAVVTQRKEVMQSLLPDGRTLYTAEFAVPAASLNDFLPEQGDVMAWAGTDCFCVDWQLQQLADNNFKVTLSARKLDKAVQVELTSNEQHVGFSATGTRYNEIVWSSKWSVPTNLIENYQNIIGTTASWAGSGCLITACSVQRLSKAEYLVTLEARNAFSRQLNMSSGVPDDRSNLASREDLNVTYRDLLVTTSQAGYQANRYGVVTPRSGWYWQLECPLVCSDNTPFPLYNRNLPTMVVCQSKYFSKGTGSNLDKVEQWRNAGVIFNGQIGNLTANWLKMDIKASDVLDNEGKLWTKIDYYYRLPPAGQQWNGYFFGEVQT